MPGECFEHDVRWFSGGINCPVCEANKRIVDILFTLRGCSDYVPEILKEKIAAVLKEQTKINQAVRE